MAARSSTNSKKLQGKRHLRQHIWTKYIPTLSKHLKSVRTALLVGMVTKHTN